MVSRQVSNALFFSKRWYDDCSFTKPTIDMMMLFPKEVVSIISEGMVNFAICKFNIESRLKDSRRLGSKIVLALFQSLKKRRQSDECAHLHRIINYLMVLDNVSRRMMVSHLLELAQHVRYYTETCQEYHQAVKLDDVDTITKTYVKSGNEAAKAVLHDIRQDFNQKIYSFHEALKRAQTEAPKSPRIHTRIDAQNRDMKVQDN
ncbi:MAG: hypothetical protein VKK59_03045 [Vampirovibrionales bacterium]|nr:hypothetical protein [Vampirovibrionales bacterium]